MLCIVTACISAGSVVRYVTDGLEHETGVAHVHAAMGLAPFAIDDHHHEATAPDDGDDAPKGAVRHHHHHGEFASAPMAVAAMTLDRFREGLPPAALDDAFRPADPASGFKRPPRTVAASV
jgi:hypothetical protein